MAETLLFLALVLFLAVLQFVIMSIMWSRFTRLLRAQEPRNATVVIRSFGPDADALSRALARHTRLELREIDELVEERRTGPLPLPLSTRRANLLAGELRDLGADVEVERRAAVG